MSRSPIARDAIRRARVAFALLAALYILSAWIDPCDGHSCSPGERAATSLVTAD